MDVGRTSELRLSPDISNKCNKAIVVAGCYRSGTTILGKLISSFENIEYYYEPPTLMSLLPVIDNIPQNYWKLLYESYIYEDFYINSQAGRRYNFRKDDDSCIYDIRTSSYIEGAYLSRLQRKI